MLSGRQLAFLQHLLDSPSPSGGEGPARKIYVDYCRKAGADVRIDRHGNAIAVAGKGGLKIMLSGHMDEIGLLVKHIDDSGYVYLTQVGGWDASTIVASRLIIEGAKGPVAGVAGRVPIHTIKDEDRKKAPELKDLWVDIGVVDRKAALKLIQVGDPVRRDTQFARLQGDIAVARAFDNKVGVLAAAEAVVHAVKQKLAVTVVGVATVQEETGLAGAATSAFGVEPDVAIAVDVGWTSDHPGTRKEELGDLRLGRGPVVSRGPNLNPRLTQLIIDTAHRMKMEIQLEAVGGDTYTDADSIFRSRSGVPSALISIPTRYLHTGSEVASLADIAATVELVNGTIDTLAAGVDLAFED